MASSKHHNQSFSHTIQIYTYQAIIIQYHSLAKLNAHEYPNPSKPRLVLNDT